MSIDLSSASRQLQTISGLTDGQYYCPKSQTRKPIHELTGRIFKDFLGHYLTLVETAEKAEAVEDINSLIPSLTSITNNNILEDQHRRIQEKAFNKPKKYKTARYKEVAKLFPQATTKTTQVKELLEERYTKLAQEKSATQEPKILVEFKDDRGRIIMGNLCFAKRVDLPPRAEALEKLNSPAQTGFNS